jgi:hypothetical protein
MLCIKAIAAHIPLPDCTIRTWNGIGTADDPDYKIAGRETAFSRRLKYSP